MEEVEAALCGLAVEALFRAVVPCRISPRRATSQTRVTTPPRMERMAHSTEEREVDKWLLDEWGVFIHGSGQGVEDRDKPARRLK